MDKSIYQANTNQKKVKVAILISAEKKYSPE